MYASIGFLLFMILSQLVLYNSYLNISIAILLMTRLVLCVALFSSLGLDVGCRKKIGKWSEISILSINVLKLVFTNKFVRIWFVIVDAFLVTLVGLLIIGI